MHGSKLNPQATSQYALTYSQQITEEFFQNQEGISGQEIISLSPIKQINFFVLKVLFEEWQEETKKFKSPYFDYRNEEVNTALRTLVNTLSKHIYIQKEDFLSLLVRATENTLVWLYNPAAFLNQEVQKSPEKDLCKELRANSKYIKLNKELYDEIIQNLENGVSTEKAVVESVIKNSVENFSEEVSERGEVETLFNAVAPLDIFQKEEAPVAVTPAPETETESEIEEADNFFDTLEELPEIEQEEDEVKPNQSESISMEEEFQPEEAPKKKPEPIVNSIKGNKSPNINEQFAGQDIQTLNQRYEETEVRETLASQMENKPTEELTRSISINQRYMFINELFEGNEKDYEKSLYQMETSKSFDASVELLVQSYAKKYAWDMNSDEVKELLKVIFKRFRN